MKNKTLILSTGLAMFSMFFGSGNLVFLVLVGKISEGHYLLAAIGFLLTGVLVPFLGVLAMFLFEGDQKSFFSRLGKSATFWFPLFALSLMGPFGVLARCITVAHGAFKMVAPNLTLWLFSVISCSVIFILTLYKNKIVSILGSFLTPVLLISLTAITYYGLKGASLPTTAAIIEWNSFKQGLLQGYQTMDLLASFFFSTFIIKHLQESQTGLKQSIAVFMKSSLLGASLLSVIYVALVILGAIYAPQLAGVPSQEMLNRIAILSLGSWAAPILSTTVILACLTTAIVLTSLFADFTRKEILKGQYGESTSLAITLIIAFFVSTLEFSGIMLVLSPILEYTYPALILLTVINIFHKWADHPQSLNRKL